jgi:hypothetical protein
MALKGKLPVRTKITMDGNVLSKYLISIHLRNDMMYALCKGLNNKLTCGKTNSTVRQSLKTKIRRQRRLTFHTAPETLPYGSKCWASNERERT